MKYPGTEMIVGISIGTIVSLAIIVLVAFFLIRKNRREIKQNTIGFKFENKIKNYMHKFAKEFDYKFLDGGLFKYASSQQFELDGILITHKAVYIIEMKFYQGHLEGTATSSEITISNNGRSKNFKNPLLQNFKHIQHFYKMIGFNVPAFSLIILPNEATFDIKELESWSLITTEEKFPDMLIDVENDLKDDADLSNSKIKTIIQIVNDSRTASVKDLKKFGKIIGKNEDKTH